MAEGAQTWGARIFIYVALSAALRATSLALAQKCILGCQYREKLTIPLTSSSTRSATLTVQNSNINCGFLGKLYCLRQYLRQFKEPAAGEIF